jgi:two-component system chemotaxis response regulator CheY
LKSSVKRFFKPFFADKTICLCFKFSDFYSSADYAEISAIPARKGRRMSKRVLIVDDSSIMRKMVRKNLESGGHTILGEAKNGIEAIDLYRSLKPEVVTMDVTMRDMDGFTAAEKILAFDPNARIIFLSNLDKDKYSENAARLGSLGYIKKHNAKEMLALIESIPVK